MGLTIVSTPTNHKHSRDDVDVDAEGGESSSKKRKVTNSKPQPDMMTVNIRIRIAPDAPLQTVSLEIAFPTRCNPIPFEKKLLTLFPTLQEYDIVIPSPVKVIPYCEFCECQNLSAVKLPDTLCNIQDNAFDGCKKLHKINFPSNLKSIGDYAFADCKSITNVDLPKSVVCIDNAFEECGVENVILRGADNLGAEIFKNCESLRCVTFLHDGEDFDIGDFDGCKALQTFRVPRSTLQKNSRNDQALKNMLNFFGARLELIDDKETTPKCAMCLENVPLNTMFTKCSHVFCVSCCVKGGYLYDGETKKNCPVCKTEHASSCIKVMIRP